MRKYIILTLCTLVQTLFLQAQSSCSFQPMSTLGGVGVLFRPSGMVLHPSGAVVVESSNSRLQLFPTSTTHTFPSETFGSFGGGLGQFRNPQFIAMDSAQRLYVTEIGNNRIQVLSLSGTSFSPLYAQTVNGTGMGTLDWPMGISVYKSYVAVSESGFLSSRISLYSISGHSLIPLSTFGGYGSGFGQFNSPAGISFTAEGLLYVADKSNSRIQVLSLAGSQFHFLSSFGGNGSQDGLFQFPTHICTALNDLVVCDQGNQRLQAFRQKNGYIFQDKFGSLGSAVGQFSNPTGLAFSPQDSTLWVSDQDAFGINNHRITKWKVPVGLDVSITGPVSVNAKSPVVFTSTTVGNPISLVWQRGFNFQNTTLTGAELHFPMVSKLNENRYRLLASNGCRTIGSNFFDFHVELLNQTLTGAQLLSTYTYGGKNLSLQQFTTNNGIPLIFQSADPEIADVVSDSLIFYNAGFGGLTVGNLGNEFYRPFSQYFDFEVVPAKPKVAFVGMPSQLFLASNGGGSKLKISFTINTSATVQWSIVPAVGAALFGDSVYVTQPGTYTLSGYTMAERNFTASDTIQHVFEVGLLTNVSVKEQPEIVVIFPNPTQGSFTLQSFGEKLLSASISTLEGKLVSEWKGKETEWSYHLPSGTYVVQIGTEKSVLFKKLRVW